MNSSTMQMLEESLCSNKLCDGSNILTNKNSDYLQVIKNLKYHHPHFQEKKICSSLLFRPIISFDVTIKMPRRLTTNVLSIFFFWTNKKSISDYFHCHSKELQRRILHFSHKKPTSCENIPGNQIWTKDRRIRGRTLSAWHTDSSERETPTAPVLDPHCVCHWGLIWGVGAHTSPELMLPTSWSLAQSYFWQFSPYDLNSLFWFHARRAPISTLMIDNDSSDILSQILNTWNGPGSVYYYFSSLEFLNQSSVTRTNTRAGSGICDLLKRITLTFFFLTKLKAHHLLFN